MKRLLSIALIAVLSVCVFASCHPESYTLSESQMDSIIIASEDSTEKKRPSADEITGVYAIKGTDDHSDYTEWGAHVSLQGKKYVLQVVLPNNTPKAVTDQILERVSSKYDPATGRFEQIYVAEDHTSMYEAFFSKENGKIKIDLQNTFFYHSDGIVYTGIKAIGYKE